MTREIALSILADSNNYTPKQLKDAIAFLAAAGLSKPIDEE